jgi:hypothetical protein
LGEKAYRPPGWRIAVGIVISLLLHAAAVFFLRLPEPRTLADPRNWLTQVEVRIVPPPAPELPEPEAVPETVRPKVAAAEPRRQRRRTDPSKEVAKAPTQFSSSPARESTLVLPPAEPGPTQGFDREAAKAAARDIAGELAPSPEKLRATRDEKLARRIQEAARPHCKDGIPGGLLAPLYLMMEKKDSGCKW